MDCNISIYLDQRTQKKNGEHPIKLRVYSRFTKKAKFYGLSLSISKRDYNAIIDPDIKVRGSKREYQLLLQEIETRAYNIAKELSPFNFDRFEKKMFRSRNASFSLKYHYEQKINSLLENDQISTASTYRLSFRSIEQFLVYEKKGKIEEFTFHDINVNFLQKYENYMIKRLGRSRNTISIYLRALRTIFNEAIEMNDINKDIYPFGKNKYRIPQSTSRRSALSKEQLALLYDAKPETPEQRKAKDFWFLSYACNGMNIKDLALLKKNNLRNDFIAYYRAKTINTRKDNLQEIQVFINPFVQEIINKYATGVKSDDYLFPILDKNDNPSDQQRKIKAFTRFINQHINLLANSIGFDFRISTYWARHSFATNAIRKGASMEFISEALNHSNLKTTKNYFAGFEDEKKKEFAISLMDFK